MRVMALTFHLRRHSLLTASFFQNKASLCHLQGTCDLPVSTIRFTANPLRTASFLPATPLRLTAKRIFLCA